uniref:Uncharacterized protein n=1 Tax=Clastoptera arizonana TaxID=38151 RepID=A0A1B6D013_9HEMI
MALIIGSFLLYFGVSVISSSDATYTADVNAWCRNDILGFEDFNFDSYAGKEYKFILVPNIDDTKSYLDARQNFIQIDKWYFILTGNLKNGSQVNSYYKVDSVEGPNIFHTQYVNGVETEIHRRYTVYGYKENRYIQLYLCGKELSERYDVDLRFLLAFGNVWPTNEEMDEIKANDVNNNFNGSIVGIGSNY